MKLTEKTQQLSGIAITILDSANYQDEFSAYGSALTLLPLISLQHRYQLAQAEHSSAKAKYSHSEQSISRQKSLFQHGVASKRSLQGQELQRQVDKASAHAAQIQGKAIADVVLLQWGKQLTDWALSAKGDELNKYLSGQMTLIKITLPATKQLSKNIHTIYIEPSGDRSKASTAELIGSAPQADDSIQGESYFFKTNNPKIKTGMRVAAWIPVQSSRTGVVIPKSALIWHMDQSFVYIKTDAHTFTRRTIGHYAVTADGYFVENYLKPGEHVVTMGGQLLLSEEFRVQIPDEDND
ncbi:MAG: hypothetical protein HOP23_16860 [Methylococcaceae bacterium]|nr:hypothetical protein [Methylococcaceae bacterium]